VPLVRFYPRLFGGLGGRKMAAVGSCGHFAAGLSAAAGWTWFAGAEEAIWVASSGYERTRITESSRGISTRLALSVWSTYATCRSRVAAATPSPPWAKP